MTDDAAALAAARAEGYLDGLHAAREAIEEVFTQVGAIAEIDSLIDGAALPVHPPAPPEVDDDGLVAYRSSHDGAVLKNVVIRQRPAVAAPPAPLPLDVERLAVAVRQHRDPLTGETHCGIDCAMQIARLATPEPTEENR